MALFFRLYARVGQNFDQHRNGLKKQKSIYNPAKQNHFNAWSEMLVEN